MRKKLEKAVASMAADAKKSEAGPSAAMLALFKPSPVDKEKAGGITLTRRNMPAMYKPGHVPIGATITGVLVDVMNSPVSTVKGKLLWLHLCMFSQDGKKLLKTGKEITFPCTGTIRNALAPGVDGDKDLQAALEKLKGHLIVATRTDDKPSKYGREMFMFETFTSDGPVDLGKLEVAALPAAETAVDKETKAK